MTTRLLMMWMHASWLAEPGSCTIVVRTSCDTVMTRVGASCANICVDGIRACSIACGQATAVHQILRMPSVPRTCGLSVSKRMSGSGPSSTTFASLQALRCFIDKSSCYHLINDGDTLLQHSEC